MTPRWAGWMPALLFAPLGVVIVLAWLEPGTIAAWILLLSFCA